MNDEFAWLEDVEGDDALDWVRKMNALTEGDLFTDPLFEQLRTSALEILEADDRIPMPMFHGDSVLNFWTDANHRRGILRRMSREAYKAESTDWETVLDVDALGEAESESWVFHGMSTRKPDRRRALIALSPGGSDSSVTREFDLVEKRFIPPDEGGFVRPLAKGGLTWIDDDTVYVATDFGPGSLTKSGYPRIIKRWERATDIDDAVTVFEGEESDVSASVSVSTLRDYPHHSFSRSLDFYTARRWILRDGDLVQIEAPEHGTVAVRERWMFILPRTDWTVDGTTYAGGSLLVANLEGYLSGERDIHVLFAPTESASLDGYTFTKHHVVLSILEDVRNHLEVHDLGVWEPRPYVGAPELWSVNVGPVDPDESDECLLIGDDFLNPATLFIGTVDDEPTVLRKGTSRFDATGLRIEQRFATSLDGTRIPYFLVGPEESDGPAPTLLGGYGGFEVSRVAAYAGVLGRSWLARGGTYVLANIRGGGEYGPKWHQAGLRENRHRVYEDFEAVARDLIDTGVTTPSQLGTSGGSNGGLLVGNMYVRAPELFGAIVCQVPLLDMKRYPHLLAGASWMAEYGDPDVEEDWEFIQTFSPYHLVKTDATYPPMLLTTSTRDDRVHPGHARKMAALLSKLGHDVTYWENIEGGHGGAADAPQQAVMQALSYTFLARHLMGASA
ncbi:MAG TPA: prolyl oligopeptidase family serine peptidase [Acidimicrobiales bacterium]|nr:prolyl oligopeptidase family serine peptidase [Acidimicrobiales bacterium]